MTNAVAGVGLAPDAAMVTFPIELFLPGSDISPVEARKREFYDGLTRWRSAFAGDGAGEAPMIHVEGTSVEDAFARANHLMLANRWGDGLPLWPPTRERVDRILNGPRAPASGARCACCSRTSAAPCPASAPWPTTAACATRTWSSPRTRRACLRAGRLTALSATASRRERAPSRSPSPTGS